MGCSGGKDKKAGATIEDVSVADADGPADEDAVHESSSAKQPQPTDQLPEQQSEPDSSTDTSEIANFDEELTVDVCGVLVTASDLAASEGEVGENAVTQQNSTSPKTGQNIEVKFGQSRTEEPRSRASTAETRSRASSGSTVDEEGRERSVSIEMYGMELPSSVLADQGQSP